MIHGYGVPMWLLTGRGVELDTIIFLHIATAAVLLGGMLAFLVLVTRARNAVDAATATTTATAAVALYRSLVLPAGTAVGILGILLLLRYDAKGILDAGKQIWAHISGVLWLVVMGLGVLIRRQVQAAAASGASVRERLASPGVVGLIMLNVALVIGITILMVYQPFVRS